MTTIVTRAGKGSPLTFTEADANFTNLNTYKYESGDSPTFSTVTISGTTFTVNSNQLITQNSADSQMWGFGATPVQWDQTTGTDSIGIQLGTKGFFVNRGSTYTVLSHGMRVNSSGAQVYTTTGLSPMWLHLSGGGAYFYGASSGTEGNTITPNLPFYIDAQTNTTYVNNDAISAANSMGFRNRIINGDMRIDQRNAGAAVSVSSSSNFYGVDRFYGTGQNADGVFSIDQGTTSPPEGFGYYTRVTTTTADAAIGATQQYLFSQAIEGTNCGDLGFGLSTAKTITLSFRVRSSLTGTFGGSLMNSAFDRSYPFSYTISAANTWETKTITITGDTSGTWLTTTGVGLRVWFSIGAGSTYCGTAGAWSGSFLVGVTGQTQLMSTLNATWDITGVQLEVGSVATPFERRPYGTEFALCERYYQKHSQISASGDVGFTTINFSTTQTVGQFFFPTRMRSAPTLGTNGTAAHYRIIYAGGAVNCNAVPTLSSTSTTSAYLSATCAGGLTAGQAGHAQTNDNTAYLSFSAEL